MDQEETARTLRNAMSRSRRRALDAEEARPVEPARTCKPARRSRKLFWRGGGVVLCLISAYALLAAFRSDSPGAAPDGMAWIPSGDFWMGTDDEQFPDAQPVHEVSVDGFWMDRTAVTNEQFAQFVRETGYVTVAERKPEAKDFPDVPPERLVAGSPVFTPPK